MVKCLSLNNSSFCIKVFFNVKWRGQSVTYPLLQFCEAGGLAIMHKKNESNSKVDFLKESCLVLATNKKSLSKYGDNVTLFPSKYGNFCI
jgi:hypothetical protein